MMKYFLGALLIPICVFAAEAETPKLTVQGKATIQKAADQAILSIGVVTEAEEAQMALQDNNRKMRTVIDTLKGLGFEKTDYETGRFQVTPQYTARPPKAPDNWKPSIMGYQVTNTLTVKTEMLKRLGEIVDAVNRAGANTINNIQFTLKDSREYRNEAIKAATDNAIQDAQALAEAAHVRLGDLFFISLDQAHVALPMMKSTPLMGRMETSPPIEAGDVDISASVKVVYTINGSS